MYMYLLGIANLGFYLHPECSPNNQLDFSLATVVLLVCNCF